MSYILDALRRSQAERERERGQVPGLEARPAVAVPQATSGARTRWAAGAAAVVFGVLAGAALWLWRTPPVPPPAGAGPAAAAALTPAAAGGPASAAPVPVVAQAPALGAPRAAEAGGSVTPSPAPPAPLPLVVSAPPAAPGIAAPAAAATAIADARPAPVPAAASVPAAPVTVALAALTPEQRRDLPPLAMGGSIWSDNALSRFVIINGQVVREGESAAPGVTVERIGPKAVWLRWRSLRLEVPI